MSAALALPAFPALARRTGPGPAPLDSVDALRGFAIALVVMVHAQGLAPRLGDVGQYLVSSGSRGVQLFFIVSAFTLGRSLLFRQRSAEPNRLRGYAIRRFARIAPMYYAVLGLNLAIMGLEPRFWAPEGLSWWDVLSGVVFMSGWVPNAVNSLVEGGWTIGAEANFYLLLPILLLWVTDLRRALIILILGGIGGQLLSNALSDLVVDDAAPNAYILGAWLKFWLPYQFGAFAFGLVLVFLPDMLTGRPAGRRIGLVILVAATIGFFFIGKSFLVKCACLSAIAYVLLHVPFPALVNPVTIWLGRLSYSIYFLHFFVVRLLPKAIPSAIASTLPPALAFIACYLMVLTISAALAYLTWRWIERPGMALGAVVSAGLRRSPAASA